MRIKQMWMDENVTEFLWDAESCAQRQQGLQPCLCWCSVWMNKKGGTKNCHGSIFR